MAAKSRSGPASRGRIIGVTALTVVVLAAAGCSSSSPSGPSGSTGSTGPDAAPAVGTAATATPGTAVPAADGSGTPRPVPGQAVEIGATTVALSPSGKLRLETLSTRASMVTGGDVLVAVSQPGSTAPTGVQVSVDGRDVASRFRPDPDRPERLMALVDVGPKATITASLGTNGDDRAQLAVVDHPVSGPVFSGPKMTPFVCATDKAGLGAPRDEDCTVPTVFRWSYVGKDGKVNDLPDKGAIPDDATTAVIDGKTVPFIVREEKGVIGRSIYTIHTVDPSASRTATDPPFDRSGWNRRLVYRYGGGCGTTYSQGTTLTSSQSVDLLSKGYAVATSTLNTFQSLCNQVISAEVTMMVKERFIERYAPPRFTIGEGGSGGAIQQLQIAQNYPGLLDGITPSVPFPDAVTISGGIADCGLLRQYYTTPAGSALSSEQRSAIEGFVSPGTCLLWTLAFLPGLKPEDGCDNSLRTQVYDARTNPQGVRCTVQDSNVNVMGRDPKTGFARRPLDNVGIAYGLEALHDGVITVDQFLDLNEAIGGYDIDGVIKPQRTAVDEDTVRNAYASGQVTQGGGLWNTPMILRNVYTDLKGDIHDRFRVFSIRDRLRNPDGSRNPNVSIWTVESRGDITASLTGNDGQGIEPVLVMDEWLTNVDKTPASDPMPRRLAAARPAAAQDRCVIDNVRTAGDDIYASGPCATAFPVHADPRLAAGAPLRNDIVKCQLQPAGAIATVPFTDAQKQRLARVFPDGVCDWSKPGIGQVPLSTTWQSFG